MKTCQYTIKGRVQGVSFRYFAMRAAEQYGVFGTVKNLANGDVEVIAQCQTNALAEFELVLHRGPAYAQVTDIIKREYDNAVEYRSFDIDY